MRENGGKLRNGMRNGHGQSDMPDMTVKQPLLPPSRQQHVAGVVRAGSPPRLAFGAESASNSALDIQMRALGATGCPASAQQGLVMAGTLQLNSSRSNNASGIGLNGTGNGNGSGSPQQPSPPNSASSGGSNAGLVLGAGGGDYNNLNSTVLENARALGIVAMGAPGTSGTLRSTASANFLPPPSSRSGQRLVAVPDQELALVDPVEFRRAHSQSPGERFFFSRASLCTLRRIHAPFTAALSSRSFYYVLIVCGLHLRSVSLRAPIELILYYFCLF